MSDSPVIAPTQPDARSGERGVPWQKSPEQVLEGVESGTGGLNSEEAERRLAEVGPNRLREIERRSVAAILWEQLKSLVVLLLVVAMGVSFLFGQTIEGLAIAVVLALNTAIGFFTEWRAVRSMEALQELGQVTARVQRDGQERVIPADELVPGDVVQLEGGDLVPADLRLFEARRLQVDESALTGESVPVAKDTGAVSPDIPLAERSCMAYKGTAVAKGRGTGVVVATGMETELGAISAMVETAEQGDTPLERKLDRLGRRLVWLTIGIAAAVAGAGLLAGRDLFLMIETGIALAVAAIPEGLPIVAAVRQGRIIFDNVRKFVVYLLSGNVGEILAVGGAATVGLPLPLLPLQILYLNVLNDVFPALALGVGRGTQEVMDRPPRDPDASVVTPHHWRLIGGYGVLIALTILGAFLTALYGFEMDAARAVSVSFLTLSISRLLHVFNMRSPESPLFDNEITRTPYVWGALGLCLGLLLLAVYWPPLAGVLSVVPPGLDGWLLIGGASLVPLVLGQLYLGGVARWRRSAKAVPNFHS